MSSLSPKQARALSTLSRRPADWVAVAEITARALERRGLVELRRTEQGWAECRILPAGVEAASRSR